MGDGLIGTERGVAKRWDVKGKDVETEGEKQEGGDQYSLGKRGRAVTLGKG